MLSALRSTNSAPGLSALTSLIIYRWASALVLDVVKGHSGAIQITVDVWMVVCSAFTAINERRKALEAAESEDKMTSMEEGILHAGTVGGSGSGANAVKERKRMTPVLLALRLAQDILYSPIQLQPSH
ncbi:hypothetical protein BV22DRAFT_300155 [Leucogyrophana mollusca]|uniref:Uncharacterized protein n=1 Tax=Leucogyrophana mollusca TaxID=85980 RepID=A0ACB8BMS2_9AGAM|nr:hypothetical protein BV22DRAFT_300155 [Leucogyrophana mollusca]